jgi:glyoxylase-like metal-dependent hydrolase (beta-lactamase superfamily II)
MPEELYPDLFQIKIPLPESPLKYLNAYLVRSNERSLLIDTGLNHPECKIAVLDALKSLDIDLSTVDFLITHFHEDHFGLLAELVTDQSTVYFNRPDMENILQLQSLEPMIQAAINNGYPEDKLRVLFAGRSGLNYGDKWVRALHFLNDNDILEIGAYRFVCIHTPGHSPGHTCLYEKEKRFLISGDHVLGDITPNITCWFENIDPLTDYLKSLEKVYPLEVNLVLPGHRSTINNLRHRIDEIKHHHELRLHEIVSILEQEPTHLNAFQLASKMKWDVAADSWEDYPWKLKFFATGETITHLRHLENAHMIHRNSQEPVLTYSCCPSPSPAHGTHI